ncbi:uncharacterized protein BDR25DRAFT_359099 [Lindgomyces ingoldianus]|uniref:Uncharacterized protein n=1 Tax=Lindgomyces ingoldianus TaxID=673940 RepID=A0ACB6QJH4_9PLEO|nr:uncharacterized protein BDR25DRAFT_359099 [Lindgomyces ingoldianus]KAF2467055.1 hypothetical protein BDR25DRAFT_359099 [Lindgomyces ingoldianus]
MFMRESVHDCNKFFLSLRRSFLVDDLHSKTVVLALIRALISGFVMVFWVNTNFEHYPEGSLSLQVLLFFIRFDWNLVKESIIQALEGVQTKKELDEQSLVFQIGKSSGDKGMSLSAKVGNFTFRVLSLHQCIILFTLHSTIQDDLQIVP